MDSPAAAASGQRDHHSVGFNLGVIALLAGIGGLGAAYLIDAAGRAHRSAPTVISGQLVEQTLGSTTLEIPATMLANASQPSGGFAKQVDLVVTLPLGPDGALREIDVTLTQRSRVRPSASLLDGVYLHEFQAEELSGPIGLIGKPLAAADGYEHETVWYDPLASAAFVAKCQTPIVDGQAGKCLRTVYLGSGIAAVYSFDDDVLGNWKKFDAQMHPVLDGIGAL